MFWWNSSSTLRWAWCSCSLSLQPPEPLPSQGRRGERGKRASSQHHVSIRCSGIINHPHKQSSVLGAVLTAIHFLNKYWAPHLDFLLRTGPPEDGPPSLSTYLKVSRHWIPESLDWETPLLSWFPGMTQTGCSKRQSLGFMETSCFLLFNSVILRNHPAVCISCFWSLQMPEAGTS